MNQSTVSKAPLKILSKDTIDEISMKLDPYKILMSDDKYHRDWRGLAEYSEMEVGSLRSSRSSPTELCLIKWWKKNATVGDFWMALEKMDRFDVKDDLNRKIYMDYERSLKVVPIPAQFNNSGLLTKDDVQNALNGGSFEIYAALVLYADADIEFVKEMVEKLEGEHGIKLCLLDRELLGGIVLEMEAVVEIIRERCSRVIVVLSPAFLESHTNSFFTIFAQSLGIEQRRRVVIPCMVEPCVKPPSISLLHSLDYYRTKGYWDYWGKLAASILHDGPTINGKVAVPSRAGAIQTNKIPEKMHSSSLKAVEVSKEKKEDLPFLPDIPTHLPTGSSCGMPSTASSTVALLEDSKKGSRSIRSKLNKLIKLKPKKLPS